MFRNRLILVSSLLAVATTAHAQGVTKPPYFGNVSWSPNSKSVLFESNREGKYAVYLATTSETVGTRLTPITSNNEQASWAPNGKSIVFSSDRDGHQQLYVMNDEGRSVRRLTQTDSTQDFYSSYSPSGEFIVFAVQARPKWADYAVALIRADGSGRRMVSDSTMTSEGPRWDASGLRITFSEGPALGKSFGEASRDEVRARSRSMRQVSVRVDGADKQSAPPEAEESADGVLSPDRKWRAIARTTATSSGIFVVEISSGKERQVAFTAGR